MAITDHVAKKNHTIAREGVKFLARYTDWTVRGVKEAVEIRKIGAHAMNRDGGVSPTSIIVLQVAGEEDVTICHKQ